MVDATEMANLFWARQHDLSKDTPGKKWFYAEAMHPAIFRALQIDPAESGAIYAAAPYRLYRDTEGARILIALPCPPLFSEAGDDWLGIDHVLEWWPQHNRITVMGDAAPDSLVGRVGDEKCIIYADAFAFVRALAETRAQWFVSWAMEYGDWRRRPSEPDLTPGLFLIGSADKVTWPVSRLPADIVCQGVNPRMVNNALLHQARIPRARAA